MKGIEMVIGWTRTWIKWLNVKMNHGHGFEMVHEIECSVDCGLKL